MSSFDDRYASTSPDWDDDPYDPSGDSWDDEFSPLRPRLSFVQLLPLVILVLVGVGGASAVAMSKGMDGTERASARSQPVESPPAPAAIPVVVPPPASPAVRPAAHTPVVKRSGMDDEMRRQLLAVLIAWMVTPGAAPIPADSYALCQADAQCRARLAEIDDAEAASIRQYQQEMAALDQQIADSDAAAAEATKAACEETEAFLAGALSAGYGADAYPSGNC